MRRADAQTTTLLIAGMRGPACRARVLHAIEAVRGVRSVEVSLYRATAVVLHGDDSRRSELLRAVASAGCVARLASPTLGDGDR